MRRFLSVVLVCMFLFLTSCGNSEYYGSNIESTIVEEEVVVTDVQRYHMWALVHKWQVNLTIKSEKYGIEQNLSYYGSGVWGLPEVWDFEKGDIGMAEIQVKTNTDTGEILDAYILSVYKPQ